MCFIIIVIHLKLDTDAAYEATNILMWAIILVTFGVGVHKLSLVLGGLKMLGAESRSVRRD